MAKKLHYTIKCLLNQHHNKYSQDTMCIESYEEFHLLVRDGLKDKAESYEEFHLLARDGLKDRVVYAISISIGVLIQSQLQK
jgi:hypothetical protein